ncbi:transmembrane protein 69-like [Kryptolebias marmoratus]|uniref:Transmembrane protein 69 n=1 Tax=Kryptolebias marmoratus TaxID=37003 RepID=A0A3Q3A866_KRYMA|nr:transmembrane protein 69-like [Kryptolebias marmoratus]
MLSAVLRTTFATQRVLQWAHPPQRCWTSALTGAFGGSASCCSSKRNSGQVKPPCLSGLFQRTQTRNALFVVRNQCFSSSAVRLKKRAPPEPVSRELDLVRYDMKHLWEGPKPALLLGFAGLIPFVSPTLLMAVTESYYPQLAYAQLAYAASIISFLGGARWGFALPESSPAKPDWMNLANSVVPSLLAWITMLMCDNIVPAATMVIMGLGITLHYDLSLLPTYPSWFKALRTVLTFVAFFSLLGTLIINGVYPEKNLF